MPQGTINSGGGNRINVSVSGSQTIRVGRGTGSDLISLDAIQKANQALALANNAGNIIPGFIQANTARDHANAAYAKANAALANTDGVTFSGNLRITGTLTIGTNSVTIDGNTVNASAITVDGINIAPTLAEAYNQANTARDHANAAYNQANTAISVGTSAFNQTNTVFNRTNTAINTANLAFDKANAAAANINVSGSLIVTGNLNIDATNLSNNYTLVYDMTSQKFIAKELSVLNGGIF
jgi:hypothetical protein